MAKDSFESAFAFIFIICSLLSVAFIGVVIWAIVKIVNHFF